MIYYYAVVYMDIQGKTRADTSYLHVNIVLNGNILSNIYSPSRLVKKIYYK